MGTREAWAREFAAALGNASPSAATLRWVSSWTAQENTQARYNPLATTHAAGGSTKFNAVGVQNFPDRATGIQATVATLRGDHPGYRDIEAGIAGNDPERAMRGLYAAPWGSNGRSVEVIYRSKRDVGSEPLLAEAGADVSQQAPVGKAQQAPADDGWGDGGGGGGDWWAASGLDQEGVNDAFRNGGMIAGGVVLIIVGLVVLVKAYVPATVLKDIAP